MTTRIGTSYFVSREAAFAHYALQGEDESFVSDRIADGVIKIGKPAILTGERLMPQWTTTPPASAWPAPCTIISAIVC